MVLLHLSDIHFGRDNPDYKVKGIFDDKKRILCELIESIKASKIKPEHIVVTGDVAWRGKEQDYLEALEWFKELLIATELSGSDITFCPGNHDVNRSYGNCDTEFTVDNIKAIDDVYKYEEVHKMGTPLYNYEKFCETLKVIPYHYPNGDKWESSYSIGYKDITIRNGHCFRIVSFNTALLSFVKGYPVDQMCIGQPQVLDMLKYKLIDIERPYYTIAIFHHAERFLHTHEICEYNYRCATLPMLRRYVDLVLCGHTETGGIPVLYKQIDGAEMLTGGAAYYSDDHANSYSIITVPDDDVKDKEHGICLRPFTYSVEKGWYHNKSKTFLTDFKSIDLKKPDFNCRTDFELVLLYDEHSLCIPMKCVSVYTMDDNIAMLNNLEDVCRDLDIVCSGPTDKPGVAYIEIRVASIKEDSVGAMLTGETVFSFLNRATKAKQGSSFRIIDIEGNVFLSGDSINCENIVDEDEIEFLKQIHKIELKYDVRFKCPMDNTEFKKVDVLDDLVECGYTMGFKAHPRLETFIDNKTQLLHMGLSLLRNNTFYVLHKGAFRCNLYGNDFSLGNMTVLMGPYTAKGSKVLRKAITYFEGDKRKIKFELCDKAVCYLIAEEKADEILRNINITDKYVCVDNMDCKWDFIYEVQEKE